MATWKTNHKTRKRFMLRRPERVSAELLEQRDILGVTGKILSPSEQRLAEEEILRRSRRAVHELQDNIDITLHRNETLAGEEREKLRFRRETGRSEPEDNNQARMEFYAFERWKAKNLFKMICGNLDNCHEVPEEYYDLVESIETARGTDDETRRLRTSLKILGEVYGVTPPKFKWGKAPGTHDAPEKQPYGEYVSKDKTIYFSEVPYSPYVVAHEFFHYLIDVASGPARAEREAEAFVRRV